MRIAYNPKTADALTAAPSNDDITFDLKGISIYVKSVEFKGTDTTYSVFKKHTSDNKEGYDGLVPVPSYTTTTTRYLREDGTWVVPTNTTYTFVSGNGGFTVTPSGGTAQVVSIGKVDWANITNKPDTFTPSDHTHATDNITKLTSYTKATSASDLATTDTLNTALGKLEYKADHAYDWIISVTASDTDEYINKWSEIVGFLDSVKEGTDILDEFVTRKTTQTITGAKTFSGGITLNCGLNINSTNPITWDDGTYHLRIQTTDDSTTNTAVFTFQQSTDTGSNWTDLFTIKDNGYVIANKFITSEGTSSQFVKGDGSLDSNTYLTSLPSHYHSYLKGWSDTRSVATAPNDYISIFKVVGIKSAGTTLGLTTTQAGNYATLIGWRGWSDSSGGYSWEIASTDRNRLYVRSGSTTKWNNGWQAIAYISDIPTSLKNPNALTLQAGAFSAETYDGSAAVTVNIPTHTSHLTNNSGFLTSHQSLANYVTLNTALTITGLKTFESNSSTTGISLILNNKGGSETNIRFEVAGANKGYTGYKIGLGTFLWNSPAAKYVYISDSGYFYTQSYINVGAGNEKNASNPPYVWGVNGYDNFMRTYATISLRVGYLRIHDIRDNNYAPNSTSWPLNNIRAWFNLTGTPDGTWWSGITAKGWDNTYNVWLLAGTSDNTDYNIKGLFFRTGNGSTWDDWLSVSTARIFTVANNTAVADFVKGYKLLYAGQWFSRRDYDWASSATINVGSYGLDRMRYSAVCVRTGNLNETYQQSAMLFVPTFSDRKFLYLAQMYTSGTAGSVTTSVKRYADYDTIIQGSSEHVTLIWMGYIYRESTAVTTWTATKLGGPATFNLTISNSARSGTNSQGGANLGGNCSGYTILGGICNTRYFGQGNLSAGSTSWTTSRDSGMGDYMVYADGTNIYVRQWRQIDPNNGSSSNDALGSTAINNLSNNNYGYAFTRSFTLYIFGYKNNNL